MAARRMYDALVSAPRLESIHAASVAVSRMDTTTADTSGRRRLWGLGTATPWARAPALDWTIPPV